jgi:hypothetical protein
MIINVEAKLRSDFKSIVQYVNYSATLDFIAHPLIYFTPLDRKTYPREWKNGDYLVRMKMFNLFPLGTQTIGIERLKEKDSEEYILRDRGHGQLAKTWDHWIFVRKTADKDVTCYIDRIEVKAGILTPFVAFYAAIFYRWRQHRWKKLIHLEFKPMANDKSVP